MTLQRGIRASEGRPERLQKIMELLSEGELRTIRWLANKIDTCDHTIFRDITVLRDKGHPIEASPGRGGGIMLRKAKQC